MKEFLFIISNVDSEVINLIKVTEADEEAAKKKFAKAFTPFLNSTYDDILDMTRYCDIDVTCTEYTNIINV